MPPFIKHGFPTLLMSRMWACLPIGGHVISVDTVLEKHAMSIWYSCVQDSRNAWPSVMHLEDFIPFICKKSVKIFYPWTLQVIWLLFCRGSRKGTCALSFFLFMFIAMELDICTTWWQVILFAGLMAESSHDSAAHKDCSETESVSDILTSHYLHYSSSCVVKYNKRSTV